MKKHSLLLPLIFLIPVAIGGASCFAQNPFVKMWDKRFGGISNEGLYSIQQTTDGGFILGGYSESPASGDKSQPLWGSINRPDYWIVKTDSLGNKQWDKDYGGIDMDRLYCIQQTSDGGYILGGTSQSGISGDKTQPCIGGAGDLDFWIVKTDALGNKQWDKDFGGIYIEYLYYIEQTSDGGYILGGLSSSPIGGDKSQPSQGGHDYWIVKTDSLGNKQWDKDFGGTDTEYLLSVHQTTDGGYILGGSSESGANGDKTQPSKGEADYWIVKTDSLGNKLWDRDFGGANDELPYQVWQTTDGGYILGGFSESGTSVDKTQPTWGGYDYWIVKTDPFGNRQWDKDFGGTGSETAYYIQQTADNGFLISGASNSPISGNKTEANLGQYQSWVVKTDSLGNIMWDRTVLSTGIDVGGLALETKDGCYVMASSSTAGIGGYKTQPNRDTTNGTYDYWVVKFCDTTGAAPLIMFTTSNNVCEGNCIDFLNLTPNGTAYQWSFPGAVPDTSTAISPAGICYANIGDYDVQLIANNAYGSDTVTLVNYVHVYPVPSPDTVSISSCYSYSIPTGHYTWAASGVFNDTILSIGNCDSILTINLTILDSSSSIIDTTGCSYISPSGLHQWSVSGTYFDTIPNTVGCDSLLVINLTSNNSQSFQAVSGCVSLESPSGNYTWDSNGTYYDTIPNAVSCDSFMTLFVTITPIDTAVLFSFPNIVALATGVIYQWINCNTGSFVAGANQQLFTPVADGSYAVIIIQNGCSDTSSCYAFDITSTTQPDYSAGIFLYPNPVRNKLVVSPSSGGYAITTVNIYNVLGENVMTSQTSSENSIPLQSTIDVSMLPASIYLLELTVNEKIFRAKFVKQ